MISPTWPANVPSLGATLPVPEAIEHQRSTQKTNMVSLMVLSISRVLLGTVNRSNNFATLFRRGLLVKMAMLTPTTRAVLKPRQVQKEKCGVHPLRTWFIGLCAKARLRCFCYFAQ